MVDGDHAVQARRPGRARPLGERPAPPSRAARRAGGDRAGAAAASTARGRRAVRRALARALRAKKISRSALPALRRGSTSPRAARSGASAAPAAASSAYVVATVERLALGGRLIASRMPVVVPPAGPQPAVLAQAALPGDRRPRDLQGQRGPVPVLPGRGPPAAPALDLQEGQPDPRGLRARGARLRPRGARAACSTRWRSWRCMARRAASSPGSTCSTSAAERRPG